MRRQPRGQAVTELALGLLVLVPTLVLGMFLAESSMFRLEATEAATEPLWDATAYSQQQYVGGFVLTPGAIGTATAEANARMRPRSMVFTQASAPRLNCGGAADMSFTINGTVGPYQDNGGISCNVQMAVDSKGLTRGFADQGTSGFFKEPLSNIKSHFDFCANQKCRPFKMAIGDWGMVQQGSEPEECLLTMDGCANGGFFGKAKATFTANQGPGTKGNSNKRFMQELVNRVAVPDQYDRVTDFQMSYQGESDFKEVVPVAEGDTDWWTTPYVTPKRIEAYAVRSSKFLGR